MKDAKKVADHPTWEADIVDEGPTTVRGEKVRCFLSTLPKEEDPTFYAKKVRACVGTTGLPTSFRAWDTIDGALVLVEEYDYVGFDLSPDLTDAHFDRDALAL